ncbi:hypothetical protein RRG08_023163 [Elysia crispata]|uniref:Uncharacterized protein n=1 Tax=Elysia crispata TaxID=231223 RepID=A0AAE0XNQ8_9GAST|nr:hypothetical protein RRG08_023163 [Elysia crispata]
MDEISKVKTTPLTATCRHLTSSVKLAVSGLVGCVPSESSDGTRAILYLEDFARLNYIDLDDGIKLMLVSSADLSVDRSNLHYLTFNPAALTVGGHFRPDTLDESAFSQETF